MSCLVFCVKPLRGVIAMPENDYRCMPVEGACVPNNTYYRKLIKQGDVQQVDCDTMEPVATPDWTGKKQGSFSHTFIGAQVLNLGSLLAQSGEGNLGIYSVDIDVRVSANGTVLSRGSGIDILHVGDSRTWTGADDGLGNLTLATEFGLVMSAGDEVVINWVETK